MEVIEKCELHVTEDVNTMSSDTVIFKRVYKGILE